MVERVATLPEGRRMVRLGSEMLQGYTHEDWIPFWQQQDVQDHCAKIFAPIGARARDLGVRLSFHPGQFCVLASESDEIVERSILEFEYHADMARWMGYGKSWHDHGFKINVHLSGKGGATKFLKTLGRLTPEARNLMTIENDEMTNGLDSTLAVAEHVALVLDVHHHWINTGEYIEPQDVRTSRVIDSWRGVRPAMHFSTSREDVLVDHDRSVRPDLAELLARGYKKQKLRAHSDFCWNSAVNAWVLGFRDQFDIQVEAKGKNLASEQLYEQYIA
jgi:UV DNA damage repair endonuclease